MTFLRYFMLPATAAFLLSGAWLVLATKPLPWAVPEVAAGDINGYMSASAGDMPLSVPRVFITKAR